MQTAPGAGWNPKGSEMIGTVVDWALMAVVVALVSAVFGAAGLAGAATGFTTVLFWLALLLAAILFGMNLARGRRAW